MQHFINLQGGDINELDYDDVPSITENFGMVVGICAFSYS